MRVRDGLYGVIVLVTLVAFPGCAKQDEAPPTRVASVEPPTLTPASRTRQKADRADSEPELTTEVPTDCVMVPTDDAGEEEQCLLPEAFVAALCRGKYPGLALKMFRKGEPWKHAWVTIPEVMPHNPYNGPVTHSPLLFSEEVILLKFRPFQKIEGYSVDGPHRYDVLRLSGTCASLAVDEIRYHWAGPRRYAPVVWNWLEPGTQRALAVSDHVSKARDVQQDACGGRYMGGGDSSCQRATDKLVQAIMKEVDAGADLPTPKKLPEWVVE